MRRSKSNPAKYAKNYRSISQRRMTALDGLDEPAEILRLKQLLREGNEEVDKEDETTKTSGNKRPRSPSVPEEQSASSYTYAGILSDELLQEASAQGLPTDPSELLILPSSKPKKIKQYTVELTPQELRKAKLLQKNNQRKLKQLEQRAEQKQKRAELYSKLQATAIDKTQMDLLESSSNFSKKKTKHEKLQRLVKRERAGLTLTRDEQDLLYVDRTDVGDEPQELEAVAVSYAPPHDSKKQKLSSAETSNPELDLPRETDMEPPRAVDDDPSEDQAKISESLETSLEELKPQSFAAMMLASLSKVKSDSEQQAIDKPQEGLKGKLEALATDRPVSERYVPPTPTVVKTAAALGMQARQQQTGQTRVIEIARPKDVQATRYDLPVSAMEFEVMDAIRNNDVTIICGETGSGKSTQIPQLIYSAGLSQPMASDPKGDHFLIGVTQPRRVAATSTAKRVCYEMGQGDGQSIRGKGGKGNLVAYQTRYETAGLGSECHVKFMTDGILLHEIQSDLLLRKYSVIVLDEAHERNLNTDVLIGLLSVALPLRKQAAAEEGSDIGPLKLIIMSATLRVEDFTSNKKLFPSCQPAVVTIPGRTHPVTIHHSKVTELVHYEDEAFRKVCKIHRKLPNGGILVFLTGKQEIVRMVNRLRRALCKSERADRFTDVTVPHDDDDQLPRDLDDDENDGDLVSSDEPDDFDESELAQDPVEVNTAATDVEGGIPKKAIVLPLYSLLSAEDQMKVFAAPLEGHRLIIVTTNIAETSLTIPGISYVVDTGRQKCRNYNAKSSVSSFDIMWISKAAANQRAGRAGRTGPGHCYRLYSSSMFTRHMDSFALPEVLTRPLEDVVLAMKAMRISNVANFPFATPPDKEQLHSALQLLANIGCMDLPEDSTSDGEITRLGSAVAQLPLGVRYGKMLLVGAQAGVLDYIIPVVAVLSEASPFTRGSEHALQDQEVDKPESEDSEIDDDEAARKMKPKKWYAKTGDVLAAVLALGGYTFAGRGAGGASEALACKKFCDENGLNPTVMSRIHKMRLHLARLAGQRLRNADGVAAKTGGIVSSMPPPDKLQERLLCQAIASGLLDNVAMLAPPGTIPGDHPFSLRSAYVGCNSSNQEPLFVDRNSVLYTRDTRQLPPWICYDSLLRKTHKDGSTIAVMKDITPIDPSWLGRVATGSQLLRLGGPKPSPSPVYDSEQDAILCSVETMYGRHVWEIPSVQVNMFQTLQATVSAAGKESLHFALDDSFRWFARFLFEGKVLPELSGLQALLNDNPTVITRKATSKKAVLFVSALARAGIDTAAALRQHWAEVDDKFLFKQLRAWIKVDGADEAKRIWIAAVKKSVAEWEATRA